MMARTVAQRLRIAGLALIALVLTSPACSTAGDGTASADAALSLQLAVIDSALARHDVSAASNALHEAYQAALASRHWESMVGYGDAALRVADASGVRQPGVEKARRAYLLALYRARAEHSLDGALASAQSFASLGDREVASGCLVMAERLARNNADRARMRAMTARVNERLMAAEIPAF